MSSLIWAHVDVMRRKTECPASSPRFSDIVQLFIRRSLLSLKHMFLA